MPKLPMNSTIGAMRPLTKDFVRLQERLASSIRHFQLSAQRAQDETKSDRPRRESFVRSKQSSAQASAQLQDVSANHSSTLSGFRFENTSQALSIQPLSNALNSAQESHREGPRQVVFKRFRAVDDDGGQRARSELVRSNNNDQSLTSRGRGGGRSTSRGAGTYQGLGRGGGRGGQGSRPRRRQKNYAPEEIDQDGLSLVDTKEDRSKMSGFELLEEDEENFENEVDYANYAKLYDTTTKISNEEEKLLSRFEAAKRVNDQETIDSLELQYQNQNEDIEQALQDLVSAQEWTMPSYEPRPLDIVEESKGKLGGIPVGSSGMGSVVEDGLRILGEREGHEWPNPKEVASRLVAGDFVKVTNVREKNDVIKLAEEIGFAPGAPPGTIQIGFEPLPLDARRALVETLVQGHYTKPQDLNLRNGLLNNVARITGGNATYSPTARATLLQTIQQMIPAERSARPTRR